MKKLLLVLAVIMLTAVLFVGCLPEWLTPTPESEPEPVLEAFVTAELVETGIAWSITNTGKVNIWAYEITFKVNYPMKDSVTVVVEGEYLAVGDITSEIEPLVDYGGNEPDTVCVVDVVLEQ